MKYVGSKQRMLADGLGQRLEDSVRRARPDRILDLFSGSGSVGSYLATRIELPVIAVDSQAYATSWGATALTCSRSEIASTRSLLKDLRNRTERDDRWRTLSRTGEPLIIDDIARARRLVDATATPTDDILRAYGGHYFSPTHALALQIAVDGAKDHPHLRHPLIAALCAAAVSVASSPGHLAQPLKSANALPYIAAAWRRDFWALAETYLLQQAATRPLVPGRADRVDIQDCYDVNPSDWVFVDPPYSSIQYSRLYHVLEGIAVGGYSEVFGVGRMPARTYRSRSAYSFKSAALSAVRNLIANLTDQGARVLITVPTEVGSNGVGAALLRSGLPMRSEMTFRLSHSSLGNGAHRIGASESAIEFGY